MATYVNDLRLKEIATGDESGTWGTSTNTNLELIAEAFSFGTEAITTNADTHTTTIADGSTDPGRSLFLKYTGTLDSTCTITIGPNTVSKLWFIENATSGSQSIIISQGSGASITILNGQTKAIYSDGAGSGAAMVDAFTDLSVPSFFVSGDLTVDTTTLVVDAGNDRVGIGISSPTTTLDVAGSVRLKTGATGTPVIVSTGSDTQGTLRFGSSGNEYSINSGADYVAMIFNTNGAERMRIDSSGNVGIGQAPSTFSNFTILELKGGTAGAMLNFENSSSTRVSSFTYDDSNDLLRIQNFLANPIAFETSDTERMRILANGTLLVGKTADDNSIGFKTNTDSTYMVASGQTPTFINRLASDGDLLEFRKDSTAVGSIASEGGDLVVGTGNVGMRFFDASNAIIPRISGGGGSDASIDIGLVSGGNNFRFKDLYLSGGAYIGGTGSANKLDDYEEGTFTPTLTDTSGGISPTYIDAFRLGNYTKVGNVVNFILEVRTSTVSGGSNSELRITGLPFSNKTDTEPSFVVSMYNIAFDVNAIYGSEINSDQLYVRASQNNTTSVNMPSNAWSSNNPTLLRITGTYQTT